MIDATVKIGSTYAIVFHDGRLTPATVIRRKDVKTSWRMGSCSRVLTHYVCRNERTGREIEVKSAYKFRFEVKRDEFNGGIGLTSPSWIATDRHGVRI